MKKWMGWIVGIGILICPITASAVPTCYPDSDEIRHIYPAAWPSWTEQMPGHKNEKCWFPATREDKKWHKWREDKLPDVAKAKKIKPKIIAKARPMAPDTLTDSDRGVFPPYYNSEETMRRSLERYAAKLRQLYQAERDLRQRLIEKGMGFR